MKLATIRYRDADKVVAVRGNGIYVDLSASDASLPKTLLGFIENWSGLEPIVSKIAAEATTLIRAVEAEVLAPIPKPKRDIICVGKNYHDHAKEFFNSGFDSSAQGVSVPKSPVIFTKATTSVAAPGSRIPLWLDPTASVDYEGELAVIIGKQCFGVARHDWRECVFGYTIVNDVTSRELQKKHQQWFIGKGINGFCPMGPFIVTADEFGEPGPQMLETYVNGELRQRAEVSDLIFDIPTLIETISAVITLEPGDILATGTPAGVGIGFTPPRYLSDGDRVSVRITGLGELQNTAAAR
jgi:2-keto-4-pentenoate hydratase/2-oxohepta-3-ene-1,7-dioic acid hydratase in catechol pathway